MTTTPDISVNPIKITDNSRYRYGKYPSIYNSLPDMPSDDGSEQIDSPHIQGRDLAIIVYVHG
jgi:hypothetical protein